MTFDPLEFIEQKKSGGRHHAGEIASFVEKMVAGKIPDYQIAAWLMAVCFQGLRFDETLALTRSMAESGKILKWDKDGPPVVDKHSTGGVGDTVTLIVAPLVAAMGMRMGKHSGRGLGHTGGTIDKLESIPGFRTSLSEKEFKKIVNKVGCAIAGQDESMTPADGILYSLRDVTTTVNQESLIASSIMSKKLAGGAPVILLDVKVGSGAFMESQKKAESLARLMIRLGKETGRNVRAILSIMNSPLGRAAGNALEVAEAIRVLRGESTGNDPLVFLSIEIAARLATMCSLGTIRSTRSRARLLLRNGSALGRFREMVEMQGGNGKVVENPGKFLPHAKKILTLRSPLYGYIKSCDSLTIGELVRDMGGGRKSKSDVIDPAVGILLLKRVGDQLEKGDPICEIHTNGMIDDGDALERVAEAFVLTGRRPATQGAIFWNV